MSIKNLFLSTSLMAVSTVNATDWVAEAGPAPTQKGGADQLYAADLQKNYQTALKAVKDSYAEWLKEVMPEAEKGELGGEYSSDPEFGERDDTGNPIEKTLAHLTPLIELEVVSSFNGYEAPELKTIKQKLKEESRLNSLKGMFAKTEGDQPNDVTRFFKELAEREKAALGELEHGGNHLSAQAFYMLSSDLQLKMKRSKANAVSNTLGSGNILSGGEKEEEEFTPQEEMSDTPQGEMSDTPQGVGEEDTLTGQALQDFETLKQEIEEILKDDSGEKYTYGKEPYEVGKDPEEEKMALLPFYQRIENYYLGDESEDSLARRIKPLKEYFEVIEQFLKDNAAAITDLKTIKEDLEKKGVVLQNLSHGGNSTDFWRPNTYGLKFIGTTQEASDVDSQKALIDKKIAALEDVKKLYDQYQTLQQAFKKAVNDKGLAQYFPKELAIIRKISAHQRLSEFESPFRDYIGSLRHADLGSEEVKKAQAALQKAAKKIEAQPEAVKQQLKTYFASDWPTLIMSAPERKERFSRMNDLKELHSPSFPMMITFAPFMENSSLPKFEGDSKTAHDEFYEMFNPAQNEWLQYVTGYPSHELSLAVAKGIKADLEKKGKIGDVIPTGFLVGKQHGDFVGTRLMKDYRRDLGLTFDPTIHLNWEAFFVPEDDKNNPLQDKWLNVNLDQGDTIREAWDETKWKEQNRKNLLKALLMAIHDQVLLDKQKFEEKEENDKKYLGHKELTPDAPIRYAHAYMIIAFWATKRNSTFPLDARNWALHIDGKTLSVFRGRPETLRQVFINTYDLYYKDQATRDKIEEAFNHDDSEELWGSPLKDE